MGKLGKLRRLVVTPPAFMPRQILPMKERW